MATQAGSALWLVFAGGYHRSTVDISKLRVAWRGYRAAARHDFCSNWCLFLVSVASGVVLDHAGAIVFYKKVCFSSRLYFQVAAFGALVSEEQGAQHRAT
jgi:hypothetical protein